MIISSCHRVGKQVMYAGGIDGLNALLTCGAWLNTGVVHLTWCTHTFTCTYNRAPSCCCILIVSYTCGVYQFLVPNSFRLPSYAMFMRHTLRCIIWLSVTPQHRFISVSAALQDILKKSVHFGIQQNLAFRGQLLLFLWSKTKNHPPSLNPWHNEWIDTEWSISVAVLVPSGMRKWKKYRTLVVNIEVHWSWHKIASLEPPMLHNIWMDRISDMGSYLSSPVTEKETEWGTVPDYGGLQYATCSMQGWRTSQEDASLVHFYPTENLGKGKGDETNDDRMPQMSLFGVFDGHGVSDNSEVIMR